MVMGRIVETMPFRCLSCHHNPYAKCCLHPSEGRHGEGCRRPTALLHQRRGRGLLGSGAGDAMSEKLACPYLAPAFSESSKLLIMVRPQGVEPPTFWFVASCSIQLR